MIYDEVESRLQVEKRDFEAYVRTHNSWSSSCYFVENKIEVVPVSTLPDSTFTEFTDTLIVNQYTDTADPFRQIAFYAKIGGVNHKVLIRKSMLQSYKLMEVISLAMVTFLGLMMIGMFLFQRIISGKLWQPFYETLSKLKHFDWTKEQKLALTTSNVTEFNELNEELAKMGDKMQHDYRSLKEFTENASHEIQTPLALINARVEQFIQSTDLTKNQTYWIEEIYHASLRMSRLHQGLLLLAKIENQQFKNTEEVDITNLVQSKLADFEDIILHRQLNIEFAPRKRFRLRFSPALAEILITNLINNAIKHNFPGGIIRMETTEHSFSISNTGHDLKTDPDRLFERFKKESGSGQESLGLGLAIVKQICDNYSLTIHYTFADGIHRITFEEGSGTEN
jgi:signal transduction histidine kinase